MKKIAVLILVVVLFVSAAYAEDPLSEYEQQYVGAWSMYAVGSKGTVYTFVITFLDNMTVVQRSMTFENGELTTDNKASGIWGEFLGNSILLTLAGTDMAASINDDGYMVLRFFKNMESCGVYSKCQNMNSALGW